MTPTFAQNAVPYNLPIYPQNPHQLYPMAGPYRPMGDMWFPPFSPHHPIGSLPFQPETHYQHLPGPYRGQDPRTYQSQAPTHSLLSNFDHSEHEQCSTWYHEDTGAFPTLQEWFAAIDNHPRLLEPNSYNTVSGISGPDFSPHLQENSGRSLHLVSVPHCGLLYPVLVPLFWTSVSCSCSPVQTFDILDVHIFPCSCHM